MKKLRCKATKIQVLYCLQGLILVFMISCILVQAVNPAELKAPLISWQSKYINYHGGWYIDENVVDTDGTIDMLYGPYITLQKGSYSVRVDYECDEDQGCLAYANSGNDAYIKTSLETLSKDKKSIFYNFTLTKDIDNFELVVKYNGSGALCIRDIKINTSTDGMKRKIL